MCFVCMSVVFSVLSGGKLWMSYLTCVHLSFFISVRKQCEAAIFSDLYARGLTFGAIVAGWSSSQWNNSSVGGVCVRVHVCVWNWPAVLRKREVFVSLRRDVNVINFSSGKTKPRNAPGYRALLKHSWLWFICDLEHYSFFFFLVFTCFQTSSHSKQWKWL